MSLKKAVECIKKNKSFLITAHTNLEGDALGSELAFFNLLKSLGKKATIVNDDRLPSGYDFLPGLGEVLRFQDRLKPHSFDILTALDCSDLSRIGRVEKLNIHNKAVLNIDHHVSNTRFGEVNWVGLDSSSCCEMIFKLFKALKVPIDKETALCLYVGILTDTGSFRYTNTTSTTHKAVAELLKHKLNTAQIYKNIYENLPLEEMRLLTKILPQMRCELGGKIIWFQIKRGILKARKISIDLTDHILGFARAVKEAEVAVLFKENLKPRDGIKVNFRSQGKVDVNKIARFFGGGGHVSASGCTLKASLESARNKVLSKIRKAF